MSDATVSDLIAASCITAIPPTLMAAGSWYSSRKAKHAARNAEQEAGAANRAVNNRPPGEPSLYELAVKAVTIAEQVDEKVDRVDRKVDRHLSWHQIQEERATKRRWWR